MNGQKLKFMPAEPISAPENCGILKTEKSNMGRALSFSATTKATKASSVATLADTSAAGVFVSFASLLVYTFGVFLKPVSEEFGWTRESVSLAFGLAAITVAVCSPPLGALLDRFDVHVTY